MKVASQLFGRRISKNKPNMRKKIIKYIEINRKEYCNVQSTGMLLKIISLRRRQDFGA